MLRELRAHAQLFPLLGQGYVVVAVTAATGVPAGTVAVAVHPLLIVSLHDSAAF